MPCLKIFNPKYRNAFPRMLGVSRTPSTLHLSWLLSVLLLFYCSIAFATKNISTTATTSTTSSAATPLIMQVGEVKVLAIPGVARVAVGDGKILKAVSTEENEVIVFSQRQGFSTLHAWTAQGHIERYAVEVIPEGTRQLQEELKVVLKRIPGVEMTTLGDKLLVEGDNLSDADRQRLSDLAAKYPQLLDLTGTVGWDQMVLLDVQVVELPKSFLREMGLRWSSQSSGGINAGAAWDGGSSSFADRPGESVIPIAFPVGHGAGYFGVNALLSARIDLLEQEGQAVVLAQPQLLARSGATAEFLAGGEVPYSTVDANGNTQTSFKPYGVSLRITPSIERNGAVRSKIDVEVSSVDSSLSVPGGPSLKTRRTSTEFNVHSGQTLILSGFLSRETSNNIDKIPGLGDIPILGNLFKSRRFQSNETELAVLVTPQLVSATSQNMQLNVANAKSILHSSFPAAPKIINKLNASINSNTGINLGNSSLDMIHKNDNQTSVDEGPNSWYRSQFGQ